MIDIKLIRENPQKYAEAARVKDFSVDIRELLEVDAGLMAARKELQDVRTAQNTAGKEIARLKGDQKQAAQHGGRVGPRRFQVQLGKFRSSERRVHFWLLAGGWDG